KKSPARAVAQLERFAATPRVTIEESATAPAEAEPASILPLFSIVGIGASAGGLEACSQLLTELPRTDEFAIVIVQHLAPEHESVLPELLSGASRLPVVQ